MGTPSERLGKLVEHETARGHIETQNLAAHAVAGSGSFTVEEPVVFTCGNCGVALEQYQNMCACGTFIHESFNADERPPECLFFENDAYCGADSEWVVFALGDIKPMCERHKNDMIENCASKVEFIRWNDEDSA